MEYKSKGLAGFPILRGLGEEAKGVDVIESVVVGH
jgi:hypothetical protein